jgi:hypothetical protein
MKIMSTVQIFHLNYELSRFVEITMKICMKFSSLDLSSK